MNKGAKAAPPSVRAISKRLRQEQDARAERNKLALSSIRDTLAIFNPTPGEEEDFDLTGFDPKSYYANRAAFEKLPFYKRTLVVEDNGERMKKNWRGLSLDAKRFAFWWAYGAHGPREGFPELYDWFTSENGAVGPTPASASSPSDPNGSVSRDTELDKLINAVGASQAPTEAARAAQHASPDVLNSSKLNVNGETPLDLPFRTPSILSAPPFAEGGAHVKRLPALDPRSFGVKRVEQYKQDRLMNPVAKLALLACVFLTVLCFKADRRVNVTGIVPEYPWEVAAAEERERERAAAEAEAEAKAHAQAQSQALLDASHKASERKWYYLWLK